MEEMAAITWTQQKVAGVPLRHFVGRAGTVEIGSVTFDGSNALWAWASPLADDAWGYAQTPEAAQQALTLWLVAWLENFRPLLEMTRRPSS